MGTYFEQRLCNIIAFIHAPLYCGLMTCPRFGSFDPADPKGCMYRTVLAFAESQLVCASRNLVPNLTLLQRLI